MTPALIGIRSNAWQLYSVFHKVNFITNLQQFVELHDVIATEVIGLFVLAQAYYNIIEMRAD